MVPAEGGNRNVLAWTTNPISFVGSSLDKLYRWELTNEAHPESDKPTFHDYIVEKDLEKLTRGKQQGLGGTTEVPGSDIFWFREKWKIAPVELVS